MIHITPTGVAIPHVGLRRILATHRADPQSPAAAVALRISCAHHLAVADVFAQGMVCGLAARIHGARSPFAQLPGFRGIDALEPNALAFHLQGVGVNHPRGAADDRGIGNSSQKAKHKPIKSRFDMLISNV